MKARIEALGSGDRARPAPNRLSALNAARSPSAGIALMLVSCTLLAAGDATAKWLSATFPVGQIICLRGIIILVLLAAVCGPHAVTELRPRHPLGQAWRAFFFVAATFLIVNIVVDLLVTLINPRIRLAERRA